MILTLLFTIGYQLLVPTEALNPAMWVERAWNTIEYNYPSPRARQLAIKKGDFIPGVPAPIDVDVYYRPDTSLADKIFVTVPNIQKGIPATLGVVTPQLFGDSAVLAPYPDWSWHLEPRKCKPNRIVSVYRVQVDSCQRLWVLDFGMIADERVCPPQLLAFDLRNNKLITRYEIPRNQYRNDSVFVTPIVDVRNQCRDTFVYAADCQTGSLMVYNHNTRKSWLVKDDSFKLEEPWTRFDVLGHKFNLTDGILGMALEPLKNDNRRLFYHSLSGVKEHSVWTSDLRNENLMKSGNIARLFKTYSNPRPTQSVAMAINRNGLLVQGLLSLVEMVCWDVDSKEYGPGYYHTFDKDITNLQFPSGVKILSNPLKGEELWIMTSRFQRVADGTISSNETNFRIIRGRLPDVFKGTQCWDKVRCSKRR